MLALCFVLIAAPEPGQYPGPDTGYVPPPGQGEKKPKVYDQPSSEPADPDAYVRPGFGPPSSKNSPVRDDIELGYRRLMRKDPFGALSAFQDALRKNPGDVGARIAIAESYYQIALFFQRRGRHPEARKSYAEALQADPSLLNDEDFKWHYELIHAPKPGDPPPAVPPKPVVPVDDGRAKFLQRKWIGPHLVVGPDSLAGLGVGASFLPFWRIELGLDPVFIAMLARFVFFVPNWTFTPYLSLGGRLALLNPPVGKLPQKAGLEIWTTSFVTLSAGIQYSHPIGFYAQLGIAILFIGDQRVGNVNVSLGPQTPGTFVYPVPLPQLSLGWLFGGY